MKIRPRDIMPEGISMTEIVSADDIGLTPDVLTGRSPLKIDANIYRSDKEVIANITVGGRFEFTCDRCLGMFERERNEKFDLYLDVNKETDIIDFDDDIRQEMVIAFASKSLCDDNCKGICPGCGMNLNTEECLCS